MKADYQRTISKLPKYGVTFSHREIQRYGISLEVALASLMQYNIRLVRVGCYWDEIEPLQGNYTFNVIDSILHFFEKNNIESIVTIGCKAPRYPEFYFPPWVNPDIEVINGDIIGPSDFLTKFVSTCVTHLSHFHHIVGWQVENEPLDPSGEKQWKLSESLLLEELQMVKSLDARPTIVTVWANELISRGAGERLLSHADILGLDLYFRVPHQTLPLYFGPKSTMSAIVSWCKATSTPIWITELQAEPWEKNVHERLFTPSMNPSIARHNIAKCSAICAPVTFLWGYEYWIWKHLRGDLSYVSLIQSVFVE